MLPLSRVPPLPVAAGAAVLVSARSACGSSREVLSTANAQRRKKAKVEIANRLKVGGGWIAGCSHYYQACPDPSAHHHHRAQASQAFSLAREDVRRR